MYPIDHTSGEIAKVNDLVLNVDGGCEPVNPGGTATAGWVFYDQAGKILAEGAQIAQDGGPLATNNVGEYCSLQFALSWLYDQKWRGNLLVKADSQLLIKQVGREWKCNAPHLQQLREQVWGLLDKLELEVASNCQLEWIPRKLNEHANDLARKAYVIFKTGSPIQNL